MKGGKKENGNCILESVPIHLKTFVIVCNGQEFVLNSIGVL